MVHRLRVDPVPLDAVIAQKKLGIATLETQNSDRLDFHELSVASIKDALETAFKAGCEVGLNLSKKGN